MFDIKVAGKREQRTQDLAFHTRPFVLCGLPLRRPPESQLLYTRRNGKFFLQIAGHPQFGLPFGQDRLIPIWVATLALRQRSRSVRFGTAAEMLDFFRLFKDGKRYHRVMEGFQWIFAATIFFSTSDQPDGKLLLDWACFHFFDRLHLWFHHDEPNTLPASTAQNHSKRAASFLFSDDERTGLAFAMVPLLRTESYPGSCRS